MGDANQPTESNDPNNENRYLEPGFVAVQFNHLVRGLTTLGISVAGSRELRIVGRKSGQVRKNVVNPLTLDGERYLISPRGHTSWVRNLRVAKEGELKVGRKVEPFTATELADADKIPVLRGYIKKWGWEVGSFFPGVDKNSSDAELAAIAPGFPVFKLQIEARS